jgi:predicted acetyltransferase
MSDVEAHLEGTPVRIRDAVSCELRVLELIEMPELIAPTADLQAAWLEAHDEWGPGVHEDGFGLLPSDDVRSKAGFAAWVTRVANPPYPPTPTDLSRALGGCRWIVEGNQVLGGIALRHHSHPSVARNGHIGYGIRPSARGRGLATWALSRILEQARGLGMDRVLVVCEAGNIASARTIERNGGVLENAEEAEAAGKLAPGPVRRYWISIGRSSAI